MAQGLHITHKPSPMWGDGLWRCLQTQKSWQGGGWPPSQLLHVQVPRRRQSGHVAGDGAEGIEQGGLHAGLQEQQVHVDLL